MSAAAVGADGLPGQAGVASLLARVLAEPTWAFFFGPHPHTRERRRLWLIRGWQVVGELDGERAFHLALDDGTLLLVDPLGAGRLEVVEEGSRLRVAEAAADRVVLRGTLRWCLGGERLQRPGSGPGALPDLARGVAAPVSGAPPPTS